MIGRGRTGQDRAETTVRSQTMLGVVCLIARHEMTMALGTWPSRIQWLLVPLLVIYLVGLGVQGFAASLRPTLRVDVLDHDSSPASAALIAAVREGNPLLITCGAGGATHDPCALGDAPLTATLARQRLADEVTVAAITVPAGFGDAIARGAPVTVTLATGPALAGPSIATMALRIAITRLGGPAVATNLSGSLPASLGVPPERNEVAARRALAEASWGAPQPIVVSRTMLRPNITNTLAAHWAANGMRVSVPGITAMFVLISVFGMAQSLADERLTGVSMRLAAMPITGAQRLGGKGLAIWLLGWIQFLLLIAFGELFGVGLGHRPLMVSLLGAAYALAAAVLGLALVARTNSPAQASAVATAAWVLLVPLGGGWWPLSLVPNWLRALGHISPVAWCVDGLAALMAPSGHPTDALPATGVLFAIALALAALGWRLDVSRIHAASPSSGDETPDLPYWSGG